MVGKLNGTSNLSTVDSNRAGCRLFVLEKSTRTKFLVDSGATLSCYPKNMTSFKTPRDMCLYAANGSVIRTYGSIKLQLDFGFKRKFLWEFVVADITSPILGVDFLERFGIVIDVRNKRILDAESSRYAHGSTCTSPSLKLTVVNNKSPYHSLLARFPQVLNANFQTKVKTSCEILNHSITTTGSPVFSKPRRLNPEKLAVLKREFKSLIEQGVIRPSKSSWSSPIHFVPKKDKTWKCMAQ